MSPVIDSRVVEMDFDNSRFEKNVSTSISTLDKLKSALRLDGASKGLESIENTSRNFNLSGISSAVDALSNRFSAMGVIGMTVLQDIGHKVFEVGQQIMGMVKSMTTAQVSAGWQKYADKTTSVQTIMAATAESWANDADAVIRAQSLVAAGFGDSRKAYEFAAAYTEVENGLLSAATAAEKLGMTAEQYNATVSAYGLSLGSDMTYAGSQMDYVNEQMEKLNWFTDETSYSFTDMVSNIGKFTANQIPLSQATTAMQGIATWAAISGQNAGAASRAMYNMAQAIGVGAVKLMDWKSIENANMATADFKQHVLDAAVAIGTLTKGTDGLYRTVEGTEVNVRNFSQTLTEGWFNKDVLLSTLEAYGGFTDALYDVSQASGLTATELLGLIDAQEKGTLTQAMINEAAANSSISAETLAQKVKELAGAEYELGRRSFKAAQEAKTFEDAIDATKDAASTRWMNIFENIFGDYERAKEVWTGFAEFLYDTLVAPLEKVEELSEAFNSPLDGFSDSLSRASKATKLTNGELLKLVRAQRDGVLSQETLTAACKKGGISVEDLSARLEELGSNQWIIGYFEEDGSRSVGKFTDALFELSDTTGLSADELLSLIQAQKDGTLTNDQLAAAAQKCGMGIDDLRAAISDLSEESNKSGLDRIVEGVKSIVNLLLMGDEESLIQRGILGSLLEGFNRIIPPIEITKESIETLINRFRNWAASLELSGKQMSLLRNAGQGLASILKFIGNTIKNFWDATSNLRASLSGLANVVIELSLKLFGSAKDMDTAGISADGFRKICDKVAEVINAIANAIKNWNVDSLKEKLSGITRVFKSLKSGFEWLIEQFKKFDGSKISSGIGKVVDWLAEKFASLKESLMGFDWGKAFKGLAGGGILTLLGTKIVKALLPKKGAFSKIKEGIVGVLDGVKDAISTFESSIKVDALKKVAVAIAILAGALLILGFVDYENAIMGLFTLAGILAPLYVAFQNLGSIDKTKLATVAGALIAVAAAMLIMAVALAVLAGAVALFALVAKMDTVAEGLLYMAATLAIVVIALKVMSDMSPKVLIAAVALGVLAVAMLVLAAALAAFAAIAKMDTIAEGLLYMAGVLAVALISLEIMSNMSPKVLIAAIALGIFAVALLVLAGALAAFAAVAKMDTIAEGLLYMAATLAVALIALGVLAQQGPMILVAAASLVILSAALLLMAGALAAFAAIATMASSDAGLGMLIIMLTLLTVALAALTAVGPMVIVAAAALLVVAAACLVLAVAVGVVAVALPLLAMGLAALGAAIGSSLTAIGEGAQNFLVSLSDALVVIGDALAQIITSIGEALGQAVASLGEGIGQAITDIIASVGKGIAEGITAISDSIGTFGDNLTNAGLGIENFGNAIRSLEGISWTTTALGIGELAIALKKIKLKDINENIGQASESITNFCTTMISAIQQALPQMTTMGEQLATSLITGFSSKTGDATKAAKNLGDSGATSLMSCYSSWYNNGGYLAQGFANGIYSRLYEVQIAAAALAAAAESALRSAAAIRSPSKVKAGLGKYWGQGFANGIIDKISVTEKAAKTMATRSADALNRAKSLIGSILEDDFTPVITPVIDASSVYDSLDSISRINTSVGADYAAMSNPTIPAQTIQNGTSGPVTAVLSDSAVMALARSQAASSTPVIEFTGDLAQLARILHPVLVEENNNHGISLIKK